MDQINIQSFCQVESELFHDVRFDLCRVFRKLMPIGAHQFPTLRRVVRRRVDFTNLRKVFRKLMPIGAHQFPTLNASEEISVDAAARVSTKN
jgi:hypothetical protein